MLDEKKEILDSNEYLIKRKEARIKKRFNRHRNIDFSIAIIIGLAIILTLYLTSSVSNIFHISVNGNVYLSSEDVIKMSGLNENTKFYFFTTSSVEKKLSSSDLIKSVKVEKLDGRLVKITIEEYKQIGYIYDDNKAMILLENDNRVEIKKDNMYMIAKIPLIEGFTNDVLKQIEKGFTDIDYSLINEISEIHRYPFSYDENMLELTMRDGNVVFVSHSGVRLLEYYYSIISNKPQNRDDICVYLDDYTNTGILETCPWLD